LSTLFSILIPCRFTHYFTMCIVYGKLVHSFLFWINQYYLYPLLQDAKSIGKRYTCAVYRRNTQRSQKQKQTPPAKQTQRNHRHQVMYLQSRFQTSRMQQHSHALVNHNKPVWQRGKKKKIPKTEAETAAEPLHSTRKTALLECDYSELQLLDRNHH